MAYVNYADMLHILGRSDEARAVVAEGRQAVAGWPILMLWLDTKLAEIAFDVGEWELSETVLPTPQPWTGTQSRVGIELRRAALALGRGDHASVAALLGELEPMSADSSEPQLLGPLGVVVAEVRRRTGDVDAARAAVDRWLGRIEPGSDDAAGVSALALAGVTVEADIAERARDVGDADGESAALQRIDALLARLAAAATPTRPVERAALLVAHAEAGRAAGRPDPAAYAQAAEAWDEVGRPEPAARMRWREAEAFALADERVAAGEAARAAHATAVRLGAGWLRGEIEGLAARARLDLEPVEGEPRAAPRGGPVRPHLTRAPSAGAGGRGRLEPRDRSDAVHGREDGQRPRLAHHREARGAHANPGGRGGAPARAGGLSHRSAK